MKTKTSDIIKTTVYKSLEDSDEACDATVRVSTKSKKIYLHINDNPVFKLRYNKFSNSEIKNNNDAFKTFIKKQIGERIQRNSFKSLHLGYINTIGGFSIKDVAFTKNINFKKQINDNIFSYYASKGDDSVFSEKNKSILTSEKAEIVRIPEDEYFNKLAEAAPPTPAPTEPVPVINNNDFMTRIGANTSLSRTDSTLSYKDIYVFVFDTGIEEHRLLNINKKLSRDFTVPEKLENGRPNPVFRDGWRIDSDDRNRITLNGHGTHVAGTIGADDTDNARFPVKFAVAPKVQLIAYKVIPGNSETMETALTALETFRNQNRSAKIIANMSIRIRVGQRTPTELFGFEETINRLASEKNITFIAGAGNDTQNSSTSSPARLESVITVASYNNTTNQFSLFSNYGPSVDIMAPGQRIFSTWLNNGFRQIQGTSMSAPIVAGACVNMLAVEAIRNPTNVLTPQQIKTRLREDAINSYNEPNNASRNPQIQMPEQICPEPPVICITSGTNANTVPFPATFPYSVYIGLYIRNDRAVRNY
jgi:subtilisin family serine protease